jgi:dihydroorotate dehydrogenase electron transfer subunit
MLAEVVERIDLAPAHPGHFRIVLEAPWVAERAQPGQFIHVLPQSAELMLRRPFSIMAVNRSEGSVTIVFRVIGEGTSILSRESAGRILDIIGPLGNGFPMRTDRPAVLVGGGVGIPPLVFLAESLIGGGLSSRPEDEKSIRVFLGARDLPTLVCLDDFRKIGIRPAIATEDGSEGVPGTVTDALNAGHSFRKKTVVYACGPIPMLAAVAKWSKDRDFECWVSMENKLGCGIGACLGCSIPIRDSEGNVHYERVCCDGPAFDASHVAFDLM